MAVRLRIEQALRFELAVNFHQCGTDFFKQLHTDRRIVNKGFAAAILAQRAAEDKSICCLQIFFLEQRENGMFCG